MRLHLLVLDGVFDLGLAALTDTLEHGQRARRRATRMRPRHRVHVRGCSASRPHGAGPDGPGPAGHGVRRPDAVLVPALGAKMPEALSARLARADVVDAAATAGLVARGATMAPPVPARSCWRKARCSMASERRRPGGWRPCSASAIRAWRSTSRACSSIRPASPPRARPWPTSTSRSRRAGRSPALAALAARYLLVEARGSQAEFVIPDHLAHSDPLVERFEGWARRTSADGFSLADAAHSLGASERTLARRLRHVLGKTPLSYFQDLRVERAVHCFAPAATASTGSRRRSATPMG